MLTISPVLLMEKNAEDSSTITEETNFSLKRSTLLFCPLRLRNDLIYLLGRKKQLERLLALCPLPTPLKNPSNCYLYTTSGEEMVGWGLSPVS